MNRQRFIFASALTTAAVACSAQSNSSSSPQPRSQWPITPKKHRSFRARPAAGAGNTAPPTISFEGTNITPSDDRGKTAPAKYRYDSNTKTFLPVGADPQAEVNAMYAPQSSTPDIRLTMVPLWVNPSRSRFRLTWTDSSGATHRGDAKEYAMFTLSLAQKGTLAKLNDPMSWTNAYSLTTTGRTQDVQSAILTDVGVDTFDSMAIPGGVSYLGFDFTTGIKGQNALDFVNEILNIVIPIGEGLSVGGIIPIAEASIGAAQGYLNTIAALIAKFGGQPKLTVDLSTHGGFTTLAYKTAVSNPDSPEYFRLPKDESLFAFVPLQDKDGFESVLSGVKSRNGTIILDPITYQPLVADSNGKPIEDVNAPNKNTRDPLQAFTIAIMSFGIEDKSTSGGSS
jgi:hypothetical protein